MGKRTDAYVDTSALIAFTDRSDSHHALFRRLFSDPPRLVTTTLVVAEGHGWFLKCYDRTRALQFAAPIEEIAPLRVVSVGPDEQAHRLRECWSTDRHLGLTGVPLATDTN